MIIIRVCFSGLSGGAIAGIVIGVLAAVVISLVLVVMLVPSLRLQMSDMLNKYTRYGTDTTVKLVIVASLIFK